MRHFPSFLPLLTALLLAGCEPSQTPIQTGDPAVDASVDKAEVAEAAVIHVNNQDPKASDENDGSEAAPLKTISAAAKMVTPGTTVLVYPGLYREEVDLSVSGKEGQRITFKSKEPHQAIVSGADPVTEWETLGGNLYAYQIPDFEKGWDNHFARSQWLYMDNEPLRRWELKNMVHESKTNIDTNFIDHPYSVVDAPEQLDALTFTIDVDTGILYLMLTDESRPDEHEFELTRRQGLFEPTQSIDYITIDGFTITHNSSWFRSESSAAVTIEGQYWEVKNNVISWSFAAGLMLTKTNHATIANNEILWTGQLGVGANFTADMLFKDNRIAYSNWVPHCSNWEGGSTKFTSILDSVFEGNVVQYARGSGIWFDVYGAGSLIKDNIAHDHDMGVGLYSELSWHDVYIGNISYRNNAGIAVGQSQSTFFKNNIIMDNLTGVQLWGGWVRNGLRDNPEYLSKYVNGVRDIPGITDRQVELYGAEFMRYYVYLPKLPLLFCAIEENIIFDNDYNYDELRFYGVDTGPIAVWDNNFSERNIFWQENPNRQFTAKNRKHTYGGFENWVKASGRDSTSKVADPRSDSFIPPFWARKNTDLWKPERLSYEQTFGSIQTYSSAPAAVLKGRIAEATRSTPIQTGIEGVEGHLFDHEGEVVLALYHTWRKAKEAATVFKINPGDSETVTLESAFLNRKAAQPDTNGELTVRVSFWPTYIRGINPNSYAIKRVGR